MGTDALRNLVEGNYIGTDINGTYKFGQGDPGNGQDNPPLTGNLRDGIFIDDAPDNQIGAAGGSAGVGNVGGNVISWNFGAGIRITGTSATGNVILGNVIGTGLDGTSPLGNAEEGVRIESAGNTVGGVICGVGQPDFGQPDRRLDHRGRRERQSDRRQLDRHRWHGYL